MQFLNTLALWQWVILLAVLPAIVALYFLKLRRQPVEVPSTYLWQKSIEDLHVNSLWQRIRRSLLLFLQLLLVMLVIVALLRPGWRSGHLVGNRFVLLIDNSASMNATDVSPSRLDAAKQQALALVDEMVDGDRAMVLSFSNTARVEQGFTGDRAELRRAVEQVAPTHRSTELDDALRAVAGIAGASAGRNEETDTAAQPVQVFVLSDGKFPAVEGVALGGLRPVFLPVGRERPNNIGLTAFAVARNEDRPGRVQAFGRIENFSDSAMDTTIELALDGNVIDAAQVSVPADDSQGVAFDLSDAESGVLEARLTHVDDLAQDNHAWATLNSSRRSRVLLVTEGNEAMEAALSTPRAAAMTEVARAKPDFLESEAYRTAAADSAYDLVIYDRCAPAQMPAANTLFIAAAPERLKLNSDGGSTDVAKWSLGEPVSYPQIIDVDRSHPLLQWVEMGDVDIAEARPVRPPSGGTRLVDSNKGTLLAIAGRDQYEDAVLGFAIYGVDEAGKPYANTNWTIRGSFPTFLLSVIGYLGGADNAGASQIVSPGHPLTLQGSVGADMLTVRTPSGQSIEVPRGRSGAFVFGTTESPGPYEVSQDGHTSERFVVNLFDPRESDIRPPKDGLIQIGYHSIQGSGDFEPVRRETWKWLLAAALVVLLVEWYIYNRRVYV